MKKKQKKTNKITEKCFIVLYQLKNKHIPNNVLTFMWSMPMYIFILCNAFLFTSLFSPCDRCKIKQYKSFMVKTRKKGAHTHIKIAKNTHTHNPHTLVFIGIFILVYGIEKLLKFLSSKQNIFNKIREKRAHFWNSFRLKLLNCFTLEFWIGWLMQGICCLNQCTMIKYAHFHA